MVLSVNCAVKRIHFQAKRVDFLTSSPNCSPILLFAPAHAAGNQDFTQARQRMQAKAPPCLRAPWLCYSDLEMSHSPKRKLPLARLSPAALFLLAALLIILVGGLLLWLPWASVPSGFADPMDAWFTATSAVTVTGLAVQDTAAYWTVFGQAAIMVLAFVGGLGFMTGFAFTLIALRQRLGTQSRLLFHSDVGAGTLASIPRTVRSIFIMAVSVQAAAFVIFFVDFYFLSRLWDGLTLGQALWQAAFYAVSSFNNAGFDILPDGLAGGGSLAGLSSRYLTVFVTLIVSVLGAISYPVLRDLWATRGRFGRLSLDSKLILAGTVVLALGGAVAILVLEFNNSGTLGSRPLAAKITAALFEAGSARISGLTTIDQSQATPATQLINTVLMFIGGAAGSTAGGLKVGAFVVLVLVALSLMSGSSDVRAFRRTISERNVKRALMLAFWLLLGTAVFQFSLAVLHPDLDLFAIGFEVASAIATVGLSLGATTELSFGGKLFIIAAMILGRYGIAFLLLKQIGRRAKAYHYPEEDVRIG